MSFAALRVDAFRRLWIGQAVSQFGDALYFLLFLFMVDKITKDPLMVGLVAGVQALPYLIFSAWAGSLADRLDRRMLMVFSDVSSTFLLLLFAAGLAIWGQPPLWSVFVMAFGLNTCNVFFAPAKSAAIPRIVPAELLQEANALSSTTQNFMPLIGLGLGAGLLGAIEKVAPTLFFLIAVLVNAVSFAFSAWCVSRLPKIVPQREETHDHHPLRDALEGLRFIRREPVILTVLLANFGVSFFIAPFMVVYLAVNREWFGGAYWTIATFEASFVGAMVVTSLAMTRLKIRRIGVGFVWGTLLIGVFVAAMGWSPVFWLFLLWNLLCGFGLPILQIPLQTYIQMVVPDAFMGRVQSVLAIASTVVVPVSSALAGLVLHEWGAQTMFLIMGGGMALCAVGAGLVRPFREAILPETAVTAPQIPEAAEVLAPGGGSEHLSKG